MHTCVAYGQGERNYFFLEAMYETPSRETATNSLIVARRAKAFDSSALPLNAKYIQVQKSSIAIKVRI